MNILQQARDLCAVVGTNLEAVIEDVLPGGFVIITPECVVVAKVDGDAVIITLAIGPGCMHRLFALAPRQVSRVAWAREARGTSALRYYSIDRIKALISHDKSEAS